MRGTRSRSLWLALWIVLVGASLRPIGALEALVDLGLSPTRVLAELARPVGSLRAGAVRAERESLAAREADEVRARVRLIRDEQRFARPARSELARGRTFVPAEVLGRPEGRLDRVTVRLEGSATGVVPGLPVACGDVYVGRLAELDALDPHVAQVDLVTGSGFSVGAAVLADGGEVAAVVGGLLAGGGPGAPFRLALRSPERRGLAGGRVVVRELESGLEPWGHLADGFVLGQLSVDAVGRPGVAPELDYETGLFQLVVVAPGDVAEPPERDPLDLFADGRWRRARVLTSGDPNPSRAGFKIGAGGWDGVRAGAALARGTRLYGRVRRAGTLDASCALLADAGFAVPAVARVEGRERPHVLGEIVSLGPDPSGGVRFAWAAVVPLAPGEADEPGGPRAVLFTGAGTPGVPHGLVIGHARLPTGPGPHAIVVEDPAPAYGIGDLWVRRVDGPGGAP